MGCGSSRSFNYEVDVDQTWEQVNRTLDVKSRAKNKKLVIKRSGWKTIRIFVSSTFKDFHAEREILVKQVFPDLRVWCEKRRLHLVECDLRWGVPKDTTSEETLRICLGEIDRCYSDNIMPFFLNLTSERCGWIPNIGEVPQSLVEDYRWVMGLSVTEMEIMHGAYRKDNPNSLFMIRNSTFINQVPEDHRSELLDANPVAPHKLKVLKEMLKKRFLGDQISYYNCEYSGINEDGKINMKGLDEFCSKVFEFFKIRIEEQYPMDDTNSSPYQLAHDSQESFMKSRCVMVLGRNEITKKIQGYIEEVGTPRVPFVLLGGPGSGKSSVMARVADKMVTKASEKSLAGGGDAGWTVFYHFVGAVPGSTDLEKTLKRGLKELSVVNESTMPSDLESTCQLVSSTLSNRNTKPTIIIIDAVNQFDEEKSNLLLRWLPNKLAPQIRVVLSMINGSTAHKILGERSVQKLEQILDPLDINSRKEIVAEILGRYNKRLDKEQTQFLLSKQASQNPLWLSIACEELRVFGLFQKVSEKIESFADGLLELLEQVLDRFEKENGGELLVATLCLLETSATGLLETELLTILGDEDNLVVKVNNNNKKNEAKKASVGPLTAVKWAVVYRALRPFLRPFGDSGEGRLDFYHRSLSKAVRRKYFLNPDDVEDDEDSKDKYYWWHKKLADFFENCENLERKIEEYPMHLVKINDIDRLRLFLVQWDVFDRLYNEEYSSKLLHYWRKAGGAEVMEQAYFKALKNLEEVLQASNEEMAMRYEQISRVLVQEARPQGGTELLEKAMALEEDELGARPERLAALYDLAAIIYTEKTIRDFIDPRTRPDMKRAFEYRERSIKIRETLPGRINEFKKAKTLMQQGAECVRWSKARGDASYTSAEAIENGFQFIKEAKEVFNQLEDDKNVAECVLLESNLIQENFQYEEALERAKQAKELVFQSHGEFSPIYSRCIHTIGIVTELTRDYNEAYQLYKETYRLKYEVYGPEHRQTQRSLRILQEPMYRQIALANGDPDPRDITHA